MQPWALVSPASRGIGLELARRLLQTTKVPIVATARKDLDQTRENVLRGLDDVDEGRLQVLKVDVLGECHHKSRLVKHTCNASDMVRSLVNYSCSHEALCTITSR